MWLWKECIDYPNYSGIANSAKHEINEGVTKFIYAMKLVPPHNIE